MLIFTVIKKRMLPALVRWRVVLATTGIFFLTFPLVGIPIQTGLDQSYIWAFNYFAANVIRLGNDIIFSYGPLGFLMFPQPISHNILLAIVTVNIIKFIAIYGALILGTTIRQKNFFNFVFVFVIVYFLSNFSEYQYLFMYILPITVAIYLMLYRETGRIWYAIVGLMVAAFSIFTMIPNTVGTILILFDFFLINFLLQKRNLVLKKNILLILFFILFVIVLWLLANQSISGLTRHLRGIYEIAVGNSRAMSLVQNDSWLYLFVFAVTYLSLPFILKSSREKFLYGIYFFPIAAILKYSFTRQDAAHMRFFFDYLILFYLLLSLCSTTIKRKVIALIFASLAAFWMNIKQNFPAEYPTLSQISNRLFATSGLSNFNQSVIQYQRNIQALKDVSLKNLSSDRTSDEIRNLIGEGTVDVYPWESAIVPANSFRWKPRPIFQSYVASTPWLDKQNAQFLASNNAPDYIIWHTNHWGGEMGSIDGRYLPNDEPMTFLSLLNSYSFLTKDTSVVVLKRSVQNRFKQIQFIKNDSLSFNSWVAVPEMTEGSLMAKLSLKRTAIGNILRILWKEEEIDIDYDVKGNISTFRLAPDNAASGIWVTPFLRSLNNSFTGEMVDRIRIRTYHPDRYRLVFPVTWVFFPLNKPV